MAITVTKVVQAEHTWDDLAALDWDSPGYSAIKSWEDTQLYALNSVIDESVDFAEVKSLKATQSATEVFGVTDSSRRLFTLIRGYDIAVSELTKKLQKKPLPEAVAVAEGKALELRKAFKEAFSAADGQAISSVLSASESLNLQESYVDQMEFVLRVSESILLSDGMATDYLKSLAEAFGLVEHAVKKATISDFEAVSYDEVAAQITTFIRKFAEAVEVEDSTAKTAKLSKQERASLLERFIRNANAVIGDLQFFEEAFDEADFLAQAQASPAGFTPFKEFLAGEHTFSEALFKTSLVAAASLARPRMTELTVKVDVPDVTEQGSATVPVAGLQVNFAKPFYVPPTIKVVVSSGTVLCVPRLYNETVQGFFVKLEAISSPGTYVAGTITWSAEGY